MAWVLVIYTQRLSSVLIVVKLLLQRVMANCGSSTGDTVLLVKTEPSTFEWNT